MQPIEAESVTQWPEDGAIVDVWRIEKPQYEIVFQRFTWDARFKESPAACGSCGERQWIGAWRWQVALGGDFVKDMHSLLPGFAPGLLDGLACFARREEAEAALRLMLVERRARALASIERIDQRLAALPSGADRAE
jgi:hypothetical protein